MQEVGQVVLAGLGVTRIFNILITKYSKSADSIKPSKEQRGNTVFMVLDHHQLKSGQ